MRCCRESRRRAIKSDMCRRPVGPEKWLRNARRPGQKAVPNEGPRQRGRKAWLPDAPHPSACPNPPHGGRGIRGQFWDPPGSPRPRVLLVKPEGASIARWIYTALESQAGRAPHTAGWARYHRHTQAWTAAHVCAQCTQPCVHIHVSSRIWGSS